MLLDMLILILSIISKSNDTLHSSHAYILMTPWLFKIKTIFLHYSFLTYHYRIKGTIRYMIDLIKVLFIVFMIAHFLAVSLIVIGQQNPKVNFLHSHSIQHDSSYWLDIYIISLYWATVTVTTVGYGDVTPTNIMETTYMILAITLGGTSFAYFMNSVSSILDDFNKKDKEYNR